MNPTQRGSETLSTATTIAKENLAPHYALHVALQTMKERCLTLQDRLTTVEEENLTLRKKHGMDKPSEANGMDSSELEVLREKVAELTRQKFQLTEHIAMVASENRQLWSRLSKLTKDNNQKLGNSLNKIKDSLATTAGHQNLIRSKTFTQNSPNPILRQKMMQDIHTIDSANNTEQMSLEEISLKDYTEPQEATGSAQRVSTDATVKHANSLGYGYLNDESMNTALQNETKKCLDGMIDIKKELLRQQSDLKVALSGLRQRKGNFISYPIRRNRADLLFSSTVLEACLNCKNQSTKPTMADKNLGTTDDRLASQSGEHHGQDVVAGAVATTTFTMPGSSDQLNRVDILQQKRLADTLDKMCPMCGEVYSSSVTFESFQDHVESHFIEDSELDMSVEKNFELISNTIGQFWPNNFIVSLVKCYKLLSERWSVSRLGFNVISRHHINLSWLWFTSVCIRGIRTCR